MALRIVAGTANPGLAGEVARRLGVPTVPGDLETFPDGELRPVVGAVRGGDVYVVQPTSPPVNDHLVELALVLDACRRAGAARLTAVVPYFGYARQDRRSGPGEAIGVRVAAEVLASAGAQRLVVVDPHSTGFEAVCPVPVACLTALPTLADALAGSVGDAGVVVAPDFGAARQAGRLAALLGLPVAIVRKTRTGGAEVAAEEVVGEAEGRQPVIVDDMIATAGTVAAAVRLLRAKDAACRPVVAATHGVFVGDAADRLGGLGLARLLVTDTVAPPTDQLLAEVCPVAPLLADAIGRLHREEAVEELCVFT